MSYLKNTLGTLVLASSLVLGACNSNPGATDQQAPSSAQPTAAAGTQADDHVDGLAFVEVGDGVLRQSVIGGARPDEQGEAERGQTPGFLEKWHVVRSLYPGD